MTQQRLLKLLIPTPAQAIVCILLAVVVEFLVFQSLFMPKLLMLAGINAYIALGGHHELAQLNQFSIVRMTVLGLFWLVVGICGYIIYLALTNATLDARNEVTIDTAFVNRGALSGRLAGLGLQIALVSALVIVAWLTASFGFPLWFGLTSNLVIGGFSWLYVVLALVSILGFSCNIYLSWMIGEAALTAAQQ